MTIRVILNSGSEFTIKCDKFTLERSGREDKICSLYLETSVKSLEQEIERLRRRSQQPAEEEP